MADYPVKVIQFGAGNFIRAFADWMIDILNEETDFGGSVAVVKARPGQYTTLAAQNGLFHVLTEGIVAGEPVQTIRAVNSISRVVASDDVDEMLALAELPTVRFVISNTTEAGIVLDPDDAPDDRPPSSFPAKLTQLLYRRYRHFAGAADRGLVMLPTELIDDNGTALRACVLATIDRWGWESAFRTWVEEHNIFCNTLVDRIVSGYPTDADAVRSRLGEDDRLLVAAEAYHLWAIQAPASVSEELPFDQTALNVQFVDDLSGARLLKVRILNGAHTAMVPVALLRGLRTVRAAVEDELTGSFVEELLREEVVPTLNRPDAAAYVDATLDRFRNPAIAHQLSAIALNSVVKFRVRCLPSLLAYHGETGVLPRRLVHALAALIRFYQGELDGQPLPVTDDEKIVRVFATAWQEAPSTDALAARVLGDRELWGVDLTRIPGLVAQIGQELTTFDP